MTYLRVAQLLDSVRHRFSNIGAVSETGGENNRYDFLSRVEDQPILFRMRAKELVQSYDSISDR